MNQNSGRKIERHYKKAPFGPVGKACDEMGLDPHDLAEQLGYTRGMFKAWEKTGQVPYAASLGAEALLNRFRAQKPKPAAQTIVLVVRTDGKAEILSNDASRTIMIDDKIYNLVPA